MKNLAKRIVALSVATAMCLGIGAFTVGNDNHERYSEDYMQKQNNSIALLNEIIVPSARTGMNENGDMKLIYPENYAGSYLDSDANLVINVVDKNISTFSKEENVTYNVVKYSYNELLQVLSFLNGLYFSNENKDIFGIHSIAIKDDKNIIDVNLFSENNKKNLLLSLEKNFSELYDCVNIIINADAPIDFVSYPGGTLISTGGLGYSVGFSAT